MKLRNAGLACLLALSLTACGTSTGTDSTATAAASGTAAAASGTYSATAEGFGGDVTAEITVEDGVITDVTLTGDKETETVGKAALPELTEQVLEAQSYDIDGVSGASVTSEAVRTAVKEAMTNAGMSVEETAVTGEDEEVECDVLVIGMGASGSVAALSAAENGAKVIGVEATGTLGGMGNAAQGMFAVGSELQKERYGEDGETTDEEYWYNEMMNRSENLANGPLLRRFIAEAKNTVSYLMDKGVAFFLSKQPQQIAHFDTEVVYHRWNNAEPFKYIGEALDTAGVEIRYNTVAESLTTEDGAVTGAVCTKDDGGTLTVKAKAVVFSTGSFANNEEFMREVLGDYVYDNSMVIAGTQYPGIEMMWEAGAGKGEMLTMNHGVGVTNNENVVSQLTLNTPILWVNSLGERFMNEDLLKDTVEFSSAVVAQGGIAYTIIDQDTADRWTDMTQENTGTWVHYWDRFGIVDENGDPTIYHAPIDPETWASDWATMEEEGDGRICETIEEAAEFIGCDAETLQATIDTYNTAVETGEDDQFFKDSEDLTDSIKTGPYYVTKGHTAVLSALGGVNTDAELRVLTSDYKIIPGLYATGNNVSGICSGAYGNVEGVGLGFSLTSGRLAGASAAEYAAE